MRRAQSEGMSEDGGRQLGRLDTPIHGSVPKWLEDISEHVNHIQSHRNSLSSVNDPLGSPDVPSSSDNLVLSRPTSTARYGRRASLTSQLNALITPKTTLIANSQYFVPNLETPVDFEKTAHFNEQDSLEQSWKGLKLFQQSHKGRLDSANVYGTPKKAGDYFDALLSPLSSISPNSNSESDKVYSPSSLEQVPSRSRSEMSSYMPQYVYSNIKRATETPNSITKSKSIENVSVEPKKLYDENLYFGEHKTTKMQDYRRKIAKENDLRQQIINELLSENEKITTTPQPIKQGKIYSDNSKHKFNRTPEGDFIIPELPHGKVLRVEILSTWGDKYYVGLNGVEIFGVDGRIVDVSQITASPADVNVLPECNNDPRVVQNLIDGVNKTQDDVHLWLAPFNKGERHMIRIEFEEVTTVSMIRIWNYNKSRIHSHRGVREVIMILDDDTIFVGEIAKACGGMIGGVDAFGDTILFTTNDVILDRISENDDAYPTLTNQQIDSPTKEEDRPQTSALTTSDGARPYTGIVSGRSSPEEDEHVLLGARRLDIVLVSNWGFANVMGLTGIEIVKEGDGIVPVLEDNLLCDTKAQRILLGRLFNGENVTTDGSNMWFCKYQYGEPVIISVEFDSFVYISGLRIWNYNASLELTYAGVSRIKIFLDNKPMANPITKDEIFVLRRAPGNLNYDFIQEILFADGDSIVHTVEMNPSFLIAANNGGYENQWMPEGFVFEIIVFSTWGDQYYCGLNGLEFYDYKGRKIHLEESNICAYPESINVLPDINGDVRTPDKLIDGINECDDGVHAWLAPIIPKCLNRIYVVLDQPVTVSVIKFWNYSKTPTRGVKEFGVLVDDLLIYNGILDKFSEANECGSKYRTLLFSDDVRLIEQESDTLIRSNDSGLGFNNHNRTTTGGSLPNADPALRPFTAVSPFNRGCTS